MAFLFYESMKTLKNKWKHYLMYYQIKQYYCLLKIHLPNIFLVQRITCMYFTLFFYGSETSSRQAYWRVQVMIDIPKGTNAHLFLPKSKTKIFPWWSPAANASPIVLKAVRRNLMFLPCNEKALDAEWLMDTIKLLEMKNYFEGKLIGEVKNG